MHPQLQAEINSRTAVRYLRFLQPVRVDRLELPRHVYGRWTPGVPTHPAHLIVSTLDRTAHRWKIIQEGHLEPDARIGGEGLSQDIPEAEMNAHFQKALHTQVVPVIQLGGVETDLLRIECDLEHPVWPNHGEMNGNIYHIPFGILNTLSAFGEEGPATLSQPRHMPILSQGKIRPAAPEGMSWRQLGETVLFEGRYLNVGFALRRPILMHLGWDALGEGLAGRNRLAARRTRFGEANHGMSGPLLVTPGGDHGAHHWTGEIEVSGNSVRYKNLQSVPDFNIDATFRVEPRRILLEVVQRAAHDVTVLEAEVWRLVWSLARGMTGVAANPTLRPGRSGEVQMPAMFASDGVGCLSCQLLEGDSELVHLQVESYRNSNEVVAGLVLGPRSGIDSCHVVPAGEIKATLEFRVEDLQPVSRKSGQAGPGVRRHWASSFSCYRPEMAGFANHAASVSCHVNQHAQIEVAAFTERPANGFDPMDLARFTIARALMDGSGYGYWRNLYLDSDPVLVSAAGRIFQADRNPGWVKSIEPGLLAAVKRILDTFGAEGLAISKDLSGNSGTHRWSTNAWDVVGFGHMDAYVNAWSYRALRNATALLNAMKRDTLAAQTHEAAGKLKANYARQLINPETGWVIGWRSRDGQIHDYAYLWINGVACAFGLLAPEVARRALTGLEKLRDSLGLRSARMGLPFNLIPLKPEDHMLPVMENYGWTEPTFETFTDGSMSPSAITYYLRALSIHGFPERAQAMAADLDAGFAEGLFTGGAGGEMGEGNEFLSWEGLTSGYEGTFGPTMGALYGVAIEQGLFAPPEPEWWPTGG
jgi:hypothetical protein